MSGRELSAKLPDRSSQHGMYEIGQYLLQRGEHEIAPLEKRVRNREPLAADDPVFVEQHVDVHRPRAVARIRRSHPSQHPLDTLAFVEYPLGRQWGFDRKHLVQESFVGLESPWFRLSERRAENDPSHKQIIAYAIFCHQGRILHYTRGGSGGEARLHDKGSIGIGGHINPVDRQSGHDDVSTYLAGVEREIREELVIDGGCTQRVLGVINDDSNEVGAVHLGMVHLFELDTDRVRANESALDNLRFVTPEELSGDMFNKLETWSQLALELFKKRRS